jgi:hypothetical protein
LHCRHSRGNGGLNVLCPDVLVPAAALDLIRASFDVRLFGGRLTAMEEKIDRSDVAQQQAIFPFDFPMDTI